MAGRIYIGTSGWSYKEWGRAFYPPRLPEARRFAHYATRFPTVELNTTFYRLPSVEAVRRWREQAPPGFVYAVKGSRTITHFFKLLPGAKSEGRLLQIVRALGPRLGPILWQLPPRFTKDVGRLAAFLQRLPRQLRHAIELRDQSWLDDEVFELLRHRRVAYVSVSAAWFPRQLTVTTDFTYVRLHGLAGGAAHDYSRRELSPWARHLREVAAQGLDAFVYFNNDVSTRAPKNAELLAGMVGEAAVVPHRPASRRAHGDLAAGASV